MFQSKRMSFLSFYKDLQQWTHIFCTRQKQEYLLQSLASNTALAHCFSNMNKTESRTYRRNYKIKQNKAVQAHKLLV